ncbi:MAG: sulfide/dihydroorotate dehydrogenase-like FAD/NAD-binding protein [Clostridiales bacterium]|jgi:ferredoxin--NADP+ reductase|nr:sulfide/dihydroorotate dehydrogenase-like FAD/NAD-binding protein [Clostridiales bacterium]
MNRIVKKRVLAPNVNEYVIDAPLVVKNARPGQFVILRVDEEGERIPFTICDMDKAAGTVTLLVQEVGYSTAKLAKLVVGDGVADFVGPLGKPTDLSAHKNIVLVGGGIGTAVIYPQAKALFEAGRPAAVILGARNRELLMYTDEFKRAAKSLYIATDDGSAGQKGFVTDLLKELLEADRQRAKNGIDCVMAVGPMPMMRAVANLTKEYGVHTVVSMNPIMVDGTGMCGGCRLSVGGKTVYACVDGPEFDAHEVDWADAIARLSLYKETEQAHRCRLTDETAGGQK